MDSYAGGTSLGHQLGNGLQRPLFVSICTLAGPPWAACWEMASGSHFSYGFACRRDLPGPPAGEWLPEATFRIDLYAGGTSLGRLLGNGFRRPLFLWICTLAGPPWANCWEMAPGGHFSYRFVRWRDLLGTPAQTKQEVRATKK